MLSAQFIIGKYEFNTFGLFLLTGFLLAMFVVWNEGRKDGFDEEKLFDLFLISTVSGVFFSRFFYAVSKGMNANEIFRHTFRFWTEGVNIYGAFLGVLVPLAVISKVWKWSVYRVLDIISLAWVFGMSMVTLGFIGLQRRFEFLFAFSFLLILYSIFSSVRNKKLVSGMTFSSLLVFCSVVGLVFFRENSNLIFYTMLVTLSLVVIYFRRKVGFMKSPFSPQVLKTISQALKRKKKRLEKEDELLTEEDPYFQPGRADDNAEFIDDANEDIGKTITDTKKLYVMQMLNQIKKALAKIKIGAYGVCEICGGQIDKARLKAYPEATKCVKCSAREQIS